MFLRFSIPLPAGHKRRVYLRAFERSIAVYRVGHTTDLWIV
jgi:hypothetical protein